MKMHIYLLCVLRVFAQLWSFVSFQNDFFFMYVCTYLDIFRRHMYHVRIIIAAVSQAVVVRKSFKIFPFA